VGAAPLVRVDGVAKTYQEGGVETRVLRGVSMELARGGTTSLVGVSGSGKSTLI
jgi:lipoprotein-releasing system ATP-binding protein